MPWIYETRLDLRNGIAVNINLGLAEVTLEFGRVLVMANQYMVHNAKDSDIDWILTRDLPLTEKIFVAEAVPHMKPFAGMRAKLSISGVPPFLIVDEAYSKSNITKGGTVDIATLLFKHLGAEVEIEPHIHWATFDGTQVTGGSVGNVSSDNHLLILSFLALN